jgi:phosphotransferase system IIB component
MTTADPWARAVVELTGGAGNITAVEHCWSRLRVTVRDRALADEDALGALPEVLVVAWQAGQLQLALRTGLLEAYAAVREVLGQAERG